MPDTTTYRFASSSPSSTAEIVTEPVLVRSPAAIVSSLPVSEKFEASAFVPGVAATVIVVSTAEARFREAVTVLVLFAPLSEISVAESASETVGGPSWSRIVPVPRAVAIVAFTAPLSRTATVSSASESVSPVTDTVISLLVSPAAKVSVSEVIAV